MSQYAYIARTAQGTLEKGVIDAKDPENAREQLRKKQLFAEELKLNESDTPAVSFSGSAMPWTTTDEETQRGTNKHKDVVEYIPLTDTLRLFAGWLLAWYALVFLLGAFQLSGSISYDVPFLQGLFESPLVLNFAFGTFLFLLVTTIHRWAHKRTDVGIAAAIVWIVITSGFVLYN